MRGLMNRGRITALRRQGLMFAVMLAAAAVASPSDAQTCAAPIVLHPDAASVSGDTCSASGETIVLCDDVGTSKRASVYWIDAAHLSGSIDVAANFTVFLAAKNENCAIGDCISSEPGSPILFTPDMQGPFLVVVAANPQIEAGTSCGTFTLFPQLRVIDDLLFADGFDRPVVQGKSSD